MPIPYYCRFSGCAWRAEGNTKEKEIHKEQLGLTDIAPFGFTQKGDKSSDLVGKEEVTYQRNKTMIQRRRTPSVVVAAARSLSLPSPP